jgi:hypothetical protein
VAAATSLGRAVRRVASHSLISELLSCVAVSSVVRLCSKTFRRKVPQRFTRRCAAYIRATAHAPILLHAAHVQRETRRPKSLKHAFIPTAAALIDAAKLHGTVQFGEPTASPIPVSLSRAARFIQLGTGIQQHGKVILRNGKVILLHGKVILQHGTVIPRHGTVIPRHGTLILRHGTVIPLHGKVILQHGTVIPRHGTVILLPTARYAYPT